MKKNLIALAVVGAFAAQSAMAADATTIYGAANVSFDAVSNGANGASASANSLSSNASHFGLKGKEDLGDGLSAVWQIEEAVNFVSSGGGAQTGTTNGTAGPANTFAGTSNFSSRDTFVGLSSGSMGTLIAGIHDTPYKIATRGADLFADTIADNRSLVGGNIGDVRLNNVVAYISPAFSGFTIAVATAAGAELPVLAGAPNTKGSAWSMAALYGAGPWNASAAYQTVTLGDLATGTLGLGAPNDKINNWKISGGYTMDAFAVNAVYEKQSHQTPAISDIVNQGNWYLSGKYNFSANDAVKAAYTVAGQNNAGTAAHVANTGAKQFSLGYDHNLSKHTTVYALYTKLTNDSAAAYALGNADANSNTASSNGGLNSSPSVISLGMKHAF